MTTLYVRLTGNDTTGDGSLLAPYRTIAHASSVWLPGWSIDVGEGVFVETVEPTLTEGGAILGAGAGLTVVQPLVDSLRWIRLNDVVTKSFTIGRLTVDQQAADLIIVTVDQAAPGAQVVLARVELRLQTGYAVDYRAVETTAHVDVLNCLVTTRWAFPAGQAFRTTVRGAITVRNGILRDLELVVDDTDGGLAADLDYCLYYQNDRLLRVGQFGQHDLLDLDPQLDALFVPLPASPCRNAGVDLLQGYGLDNRVPTTWVDFGHYGAAPEIGLVEAIEPAPTVTVRAVVIGTILDALGLEIDAVRSDWDVRRADRAVMTAAGQELQRRFGQWAGALRPVGWTDRQYGLFLTDMLAAVRSGAPSRRAIERVVSNLWACPAGLLPYGNGLRFRLGDALTMRAVSGWPSPTVRLSAGDVLLIGRHYRVKQTDVALAGTTNFIYVDGTVLADSTAEVKQTTDPNVLTGWVAVAQTGTALFRTGWTQLVGVGTTFTSLSRHDSVAPTGSLDRYIVESVESDTELTLRTAFRQDDYSGSFVRHVPVGLIGMVGLTGATITSIRSPGRLTVSTFLDSEAARRQACCVTLNHAGNIDQDDDAMLNATLSLLQAVRSIHRSLMLSFWSSWPAGKTVGTVRRPDQSVVDYLETFDAWT